MRRLLRTGSIVGVLIGLTLVGLLVFGVPAPARDPRSSGTPPPESSPPAESPLASPRYDTGTIIGPEYDAEAVRGPTRSKSQSKVWFNDQTWWAVLVAPETDEFSIARFDPEARAWEDTGTSVEPRRDARMDVLWDGEKLNVLSAGTNASSSQDQARLYRFSYDHDVGRYFLDADFPVSITAGGVGPMTLARDSDGRLWTAYVVNGQVMFASSLGDDHIWNAPRRIPVDHTAVAADEAAIVTFGDRVGVMWSNQSEAAMYFAWHRSGDPPDQWSAAETAVEERAVADNHVSLRSMMTADGPIVVAATKTSKDQANGEGPSSPQILVLVRQPDGQWTRTMVARVGDHHTRPALSLEEDTATALVFATSPFDGGQIFLKSAPLDDLIFQPGVGTVFLTTDDEPQISNVSVTKQNLSAETGMVVIAADDHAGYYVTRAVSLGGGSFPEGRRDQLGGETYVLNDSFEPFPHGAEAAGWAVTRGSAVVAAAGAENALRILGAADGGRACKQFAPDPGATLRVTADVHVDQFGSARTVLLKLRAGGSEALAIRARTNGQVDYSSGDSRIESSTVISAGQELQVVVTLVPASGTYAVTIIDAATGAVLLDLADIPARSVDTAIDEVCFEASPNAAPGGLAVDDVIVARVQ
jgi:hypothetical protein